MPGFARLSRSTASLCFSTGVSAKTSFPRQESDGWGAKVIDRLAVDLGRAFPEMTGLSARNPKYMRAFAEAWRGLELVQQGVALFPWGHLSLS